MLIISRIGAQSHERRFHDESQLVSRCADTPLVKTAYQRGALQKDGVKPGSGVMAADFGERLTA